MTTTKKPAPQGGGESTTRLPGNAPEDLAAYIAARVISANDVAAAAMLVELAQRDTPSVTPSLRAWLAMCLALRAPRDGHTCVDLRDIHNWSGDIDLTKDGPLDWPADADAWTTSLATAGPLVGAPGTRAPFSIDGDRLYLARSLHEEQEIAHRLLRGSTAAVEVLLGGPGTGKTTKVAARLIEMFRVNPKTQIALAAPTGKAAARMAEALQTRLHDKNAPDEVRNAPEEVRKAVSTVRPLTIHKLLGYRPHGTPRYKFNAGERLAYDLVVVDEASMLSSALMHHLLDALGDDTRLLLVGDPNQLASVDSGSVLGDIARAAARTGSPLENRTETLTIRHRFGPRIGALADAILAGDDAGVARTFEILEGRWTPPTDPNNTKQDDPDSIRWVEPGGKQFKSLVNVAVEHAKRLRELAQAGNVADALEAQKEFQVLCAHRAGSTGVEGWNARVEEGIEVGYATPWYSGRPLMVSRNNRGLDLFNGDAGIVVPGDGEGLQNAAFPMAGREPRLLPVSQLEEVATMHALTIHKSQGSEYKHAVVVLPERASRIVTRELLYTAVTRASDRVTLVGSREVIEAAIRKPIRRASGLEHRLSGE